MSVERKSWHSFVSGWLPSRLCLPRFVQSKRTDQLEVGFQGSVSVSIEIFTLTAFHTQVFSHVLHTLDQGCGYGSDYGGSRITSVGRERHHQTVPEENGGRGRTIGHPRVFPLVRVDFPPPTVIGSTICRGSVCGTTAEDVTRSKFPCLREFEGK